MRLKHESVNTEEKKKWQNVQNAEPTYQKQKKHGRWQAAQIKLENACN